MGKYLAIEIGAKEVHHYLGHLENEKLMIEEVYHFDIKTVEKDGKKYKDLLDIIQGIKTGMIKCRENQTLPIFVGIDTLESECLLFDQEDNLISDSFEYNNNNNVQEQKDEGKKNSIISYLKSFSENNLNFSEKIKTLLMLPDYMNFLLTGVKLSEYTIAATTQLVNPASGGWDDKLIGELGYSPDIFQEIRRPGAVVGNLTREVTDEIGYDCIIVLPATYAPNSAYFAVPTKEKEDMLNISDLWSLKYPSGDDKEYPASAAGNLLVQLIMSHELQDVQTARECVQKSFNMT